jgi:hypothetical protein
VPPHVRFVEHIVVRGLAFSHTEWCFPEGFAKGKAKPYRHYQALLAACPENRLSRTEAAGPVQEFRWVNQLAYEDSDGRSWQLNALECTERTADDARHYFAWLTPLPVGNRFIVYTLFPQVNVSVRVHWGPSRESVACAVGHSIFNRTCRTAVGELLSHYGGGGHRGAGTCLLKAATADSELEDIIDVLKTNG